MVGAVLIQLLIALLVTEAIETPIYWAFFRRRGPAFVLEVILMNVLTNIPFNLVLLFFASSQKSYALYCLVGEIVILALEGLTVSLITHDWAFGYLSAGAANVASLLVGLIYSLIYSHADTGQMETLEETYLLLFGLLFLAETIVYLVFSVKRAKAKQAQ